MTRREAFMIAALSLIWGSSFMFISDIQTNNVSAEVVEWH
jgi:hypothetical protein